MSTPRHRSRAAVAAVIVSVGGSTAVRAQWTVVNLHPPGTLAASDATGVNATHEVGHVGFFVPVLWNGSAASWVDLNPNDSLSAYANDLDGSDPVGASSSQACIWRSGQRISLHPAGAQFSYVEAADSGSQAGSANIGGQWHACVWSGAAATFVDLRPTALGFTETRSQGIDGNQQVGYARLTTTTYRALLWTGTGASCVDLTPANATSAQASDVWKGVQVGSATIAGITRASVWTGTAQSRIDLHPAGAAESRCVGIHSNLKVGLVDIDGARRAALWHGDSPDSWENLHAALPGPWRDSIARAVWTDGVTIRVVGSAWNHIFQRYEAVLWTRPVPCRTEWNGDGAVNSTDISAFLTSWLQSITDGTLLADFNADGAVNSSDISRFLSDWLADIADAGC